MKVLLSMFAVALVAVLTIGSSAQPANAQPLRIDRPALAQDLVVDAQYRGDHRWRHRDRDRWRHHHSHRRHHWDRRHHWRDRGPSFGIIIAPQPVYRPRYVAPRYVAPPVRGISNAHVNWCYSQYRSYRAYDNTFQPYNGPRRPCYSPYS